MYTRNCRCISSIKFYCQLNSFYHAHVYVQLHHNNFQAARAVSVFERTERIYVVVHYYSSITAMNCFSMFVWVLCLPPYPLQIFPCGICGGEMITSDCWKPLIFENLLVQSKLLWWIIMKGIRFHMKMIILSQNTGICGSETESSSLTHSALCHNIMQQPNHVTKETPS